MPRTGKRPNIVLTCNLWTLVRHPTPAREWSLARKIRTVAEAGFDAVTGPATPEIRKLCRRHGLRYMGFFSSSDPREFRRQLKAQRAAGAELVNVQLGDDFTPVRESLRMALRLRGEARRQGIYAAIEVHRDTATETPEKTFAIADGYRKATGELMPVTWDHSHFAVVKHLKPALYNEVLLQPARLIQESRIFHLRPFNGQHAQVPVMDARGRLTPEFKSWRQFAVALMRLWLAGPRPGGELWVVPEIGRVGIHGYNLSIMPPSWDQAIRCRSEILRMWKTLIK